MPTPEDLNKKIPEEELTMPKNQKSEENSISPEKKPEKREIVQQCSYCEKFYGENADKQNDPDFAKNYDVSHGVCQDCFPEVMADIKKQMEGKK